MIDPVIADLSAHLAKKDKEELDQEFIDRHVKENLKGRIATISTYGILDDAFDAIRDGLDVLIDNADVARSISPHTFEVACFKIGREFAYAALGNKEKIAKESLIAEAKAMIAEAEKRNNCRHCKSGKSCEC